MSEIHYPGAMEIAMANATRERRKIVPVKVNPLTMSQAHSPDYRQGWNDCHKYMAEEIVRQDTQIDQYDLTIHGLTTKNDELREAARKAADDSSDALDLLSRIRFALGDNGQRMQDDLILYCAELRDAMRRAKKSTEERDHYGQILSDLLDALGPLAGRFTDGTPINPMGHAYDAACEAIGRDPFHWKPEPYTLQPDQDQSVPGPAGPINPA